MAQGSGGKPKWTPEMDAMLKNLLLDDGLSAQRVAKFLNAAGISPFIVTRNAVIGRKHRTGLAQILPPSRFTMKTRPDTIPIRPPSKPSLRLLPGDEHRPHRSRARIARRPRLVTDSLPAVTVPPRKYNSDFKVCQFMVGTAPDFAICGAASTGPWCDHHDAVVHDRTSAAANRWRRRMQA